MSPWLWAVAAAVVALAELHAPGFYLIWIALGAAVTAIAGFVFALSFEAQLIVFAAASLVSCVAGYYVYRHLLHPRTGMAAMNERGQHIIGERGVVMEALANGHGKIRLGDTVWLAEGPDLPAGAPVVVKDTRGTTAVVEAL
ncbi:MAG TPA: NfeD family protein [Stellaceae bacterium]|nr:NfeD family protein [Stellaceae bacterium]